MNTSGPAMKILFVIDSLGAGGAERSLAELLPALEDAGIEAIIACLDRRTYGVEAEVLASGADVRFLPRRPIARLRELRKIVAKESPDLIHTTILASNLVGRLASIGSRATVLTSLVNTPYAPIRKQDPRVRPLVLSAIRLIDIATARSLTDHFHAITEAVKTWAVADMHLDPSVITVVHRGRNPDRLGEVGPERRRSARQALGLRDEDEVILTVGRQEFQKGQRFLLEAVAALAPRRPHLRLLIAGRRGASSPELDRLLDVPELADRVHVLGHREDVPELLAASDLFAFPSLFEGLGGSVLEAMALGLPIVASDLPAVREIVEEGENALLVPVAAPDELADAIDRILRDPSLAHAFGQRSREIFLERFTSTRSADAMIDLYRHLAPGSARQAAGAR
jgi:glycosyltransferase involved in cell wall biosynthesis